MDELPDLLADAIGDSTVIGTVDIGGGDAVVVTPAETHLYRSEGLLSDESVETFSHDVDRFAVGTGRRKRTIRLETIEGERSLTVPAKATERVLEAMLEGILRAEGLLGPSETVEAQFRFSDLTLVVTDERLLKHVGSAVWSEDYEVFRFEDLTGLDFEQGSVATQVIVETNGRPQRVKVPNDHAGRVRDVIQRAAFEYHGVSSLGGLDAKVGIEEDEDDEEDEDEEASDTADRTEQSDDSESERAADADSDGDIEATASREARDTGADTGWSPPADQDVTGPRGRVRRSTSSSGRAIESETETDEEKADEREASPPKRADATPEIETLSERVETLSEQVETLSEQVERQTERLESQQETIEQLVDELRRGR
jgi:hypothetical protein